MIRKPVACPAPVETVIPRYIEHRFDICERVPSLHRVRESRLQVIAAESKSRKSHSNAALFHGQLPKTSATSCHL